MLALIMFESFVLMFLNLVVLYFVVIFVVSFSALCSVVLFFVLMLKSSSRTPATLKSYQGPSTIHSCHS